MKYLSVCAGIEAASVAWHHMGWEPVAFSEIEKFPSAVLAHHYPSVPNWGDMTKFKEWPDANIDVLVGGTPCQSFSVAGLRKGLDDPRGNLMLTYLAIAQRYRPQWLVWENVPGVLSSEGGRDFAALLRGLAELGYGWAYRVLDAQYFGVAQRRRRVFVVGHLGDWHRAAAVLFERHSLSGHPAPSRQARKGIAGSVAPSTTASGWPAEVSPTLNAHFGSKQGLEDQHIAGGGDYLSPPVAMCLITKTRLDSETETLIPTIGGGFDAVAMRESGQGYWMQDDIGGTLRAEGEDRPSRPSHVIAQPVAYNITFCDANGVRSDRPNGGLYVNETDVTSTLTEAGVGTNVVQSISFPWQMGGTIQMPIDKDISGSLIKNQTMAVATAMQVRRLTPVECERLQGFPDGYTNIPWRNKPESPDGPRYKALGNSMAVPCMVWIGERINEVSKL